MPFDSIADRAAAADRSVPQDDGAAGVFAQQGLAAAGAGLHYLPLCVLSRDLLSDAMHAAAALSEHVACHRDDFAFGEDVFEDR